MVEVEWRRVEERRGGGKREMRQERWRLEGGREYEREKCDWRRVEGKREKYIYAKT